MRSQQNLVKLIEYDSQEYQQACQLRYRLFYAEHNLAWDKVFNDSDLNCFHLAIVELGKVLAYAQLFPQKNLHYQIKQIVVEPKHRKQNLGIQILQATLDLAKERGATSLSLNSRVRAIGFYQKLGFQTYGVEFPSPTTGVIHIAMKLKL